MFVPQSSCLGNEFGSSYAGFSRPGSRSARRSGQGVCRDRPALSSSGTVGWAPGGSDDRMAPLRWGVIDSPGAAAGSEGNGRGRTVGSPPHRREECSFGSAHSPTPAGWLSTTLSAWRRRACTCPRGSSPIIRNVRGFSEISCVSRLDIREAFAATSTPTTCFNKAETSPGSPESGVALAMHYLEKNVCAWQEEECGWETASMVKHAGAPDRVCAIVS